MINVLLDNKKEVLASGSYIVGLEKSKISFTVNDEILNFEINFIDNDSDRKDVELCQEVDNGNFIMKINLYNVDKFLTKGIPSAYLDPTLVDSNIEKKENIYVTLVIFKIKSKIKLFNYTFFRIVDEEIKNDD